MHIVVAHPSQSGLGVGTSSPVEVIEIDFDGRASSVRSVRAKVSRTGNAVATALPESLDKPFPWEVGFFPGNTELSMNLCTVIAGIPGFDGD